MPLSFTYELDMECMGWATLTFGNGAEEFRVKLEYGKDYLGEFAGVAASVCRSFANTTVILEQLPSRGHACNIWRDGESLSIKIRGLDALDNYTQMHQGPILFEAGCGRRDFAIAVACELDRIHRALGLCGYMKHWYTAPFPLYEYFRLRMLLDRSPLVQQIAAAVRAGRSSADLELQLLASPADFGVGGSGVDIPLAPYEDDQTETIE